MGAVGTMPLQPAGGVSSLGMTGMVSIEAEGTLLLGSFRRLLKIYRITTGLENGLSWSYEICA